ncbi:MAG: response regulator [Nitrospirae bacterium]|nr:response regulator [Nitrospirota bacterium]
MSILIVEDNPVNARLLALILQAQGYQTVLAKNGKEGLTMLADTPDIQLIITDYMMPEMDGMELISKVRALPKFSQLPILMASAHADIDTIKRVQGLRCDGFLVKPIDRKDLLKRVELLVRVESRSVSPRQALMEKMDLRPADYTELVNTFMAQLADTLPLVQSESADSDELISEKLGRSLKDLAESASMLGSDKFRQIYVEESKKDGRPARSQCSTLLQVLQEMNTSLRSYLEA